MSKVKPPKSTGPKSAQSIREQLFADLDRAYARSKAKKCKHRHIKRGVAVGIAHAIAVLSNPYAPDINAVQREAQRRYASGK